MKINQMYEELLDTAKRIGIAVRKDKGSFRSGYCVIDNKEMIILNLSTSLETMSNILARSLVPYTDKVYIKPVVREFIEKEATVIPFEDINIETKE
jgi:hypothetical protein